MANLQPVGGLPLLCDILFNPEYSIKSPVYSGAVSLFSVLRDNHRYYKRYIQQRGDNFLEIMNTEEESSKEAAYAASGPLEENIDNNIVISGRSPRVVAAQVGNFGQVAAAQEAAVYTDLIQFVSTIRGNINTICDLMLQLVDQIQTQIIQVVPVQAAQTTRVYDNILLVRNQSAAVGTQQIFPKFSFNIVCQKEPLLQTILVSGRENGMGKILNNFVFRILQLQPFFTNYAILKIVEPSESSRLWQVKISIHGNDFIFFTIQIINVKNDFYIPSMFTPPPNNILERLQNPQIYENLCFSLYNKSNSRDFNCLCSLSELDTFIFIQIGQANLNNLLLAIEHFLTYLIDAQVIVKKKYFILGLLNLIYCSSQSQYTIETKVYRWLFDRPVPELNIVVGQDNKNVFLYAMRIIQHVNILCNQIPDQEEKPRVVMGGGKQYSLFQKALNNFSIRNVHIFNVSKQRIVDEIYPDDGTLQQVELRQTLDRDLIHPTVKAAADADFGFFHKRGALGSAECMSVCMILQVALKKLIDFKLNEVPTNITPYEIDIGNSCIGNPPSTLSSLRIVLKNSLLFYNNLDGVNDDITASITRLLGLLNMNLVDIASTISPFDIVPKGSMEDYVQHIIEAVLLFGGIQTPDLTDLTILSQILSNYSMITIEGFSSPLKGIFDIFYTLFIIENFTNRTLVTQKINKELKRISICAQILYLHYVELIPLVEAAAIQGSMPAGTGNAIITPMLDILRDMISYGYNGNLLDPANFAVIMRKYVEFITTLINFNKQAAGLLLNFYCVNPTPPNSRGLTTTETFFMNLLENSNHEPLPPPHDQLADSPPPPADAPPPADFLDIPANDRTIFMNCLGCIPGVIRAMRAMPIDLLSTLYQNKIYASYRDTKNKSNSIVVISIAYQSFLWNTVNRPLIRLGQLTPLELLEDDEKFVFSPASPPASPPAPPPAPLQVIGLLDIFTRSPTFFNSLLAAVAPCYDPLQNFLDISTEVFDNITINNPIQFQFMFWFITCIFGIKTKSTPKKLISLVRTSLKGIKNSVLVDAQFMCNILGCVITFPRNPNPRPAPIELLGEDGGVAAALQRPENYDDVLFLAYDPYTIEKAFTLYKNAEQNFRPDPENYVFKLGNTIAIKKDSKVLRKDILSRLTDAFSKLPRGQAYLNQSYNFMNAALTGVLGTLGGDMSIANILRRISQIPGMLTDNPYKPTPHDVSKFIDFRETPQSYRNEWINYLVTEIFNSENDGENLFNHMKLLVLLYKYLTLLPAYLETHEVINQPGRETTQAAIGIAQQLIQRNYSCVQISVAQAAAIEGLTPAGLLQNIQAAQDTTQQRNIADNTDIATVAAADAALPVRGRRRAAAQPLPAPVAQPPVRSTRRTATPPPPPENTKKGRQGGGTIRTRNHSSPKKTNNHTRKNKYKRNNKNKYKKQKSSPKYRKINPSSRSGSHSNRKKSKSKLPEKNVTFKRRRYNK
jgi:hypothetical protein